MNLIDALVLKDLPRVGDGTLTKILEFGRAHDVSCLEQLAEHNLDQSELKVVPAALRELLATSDFAGQRKVAERNIANWREQGVEVLLLYTEGYPAHLAALENPPPFLFCRGERRLLSLLKAIAVVGTRENTGIGEKIARRTVCFFAGRGYSIISGLALGIDTVAHKSALEFGAPTVAVLVDVDTVAPAANRNLAKKILDSGGLLVSENPPGTRIIPAYFAKRDRIQAGLSSAVFAIETSIDGGTMHAVNTAISLDRPVYVPDPKAARYPDMGDRVISGIRHLIKTEQAVPYTVRDYEDMDKKLAAFAQNRRG